MKLPENVSLHLRGLRHAGIVTEDREALIQRMQQIFGIADADVMRIPAPGVDSESRFAFFSIGGVPLEVIEPVSPRMKTVLLNSTPGVNHLCYNVDDLDAAIAAMAAAGVRLGHVTPDGILEMPHARMAYFNPDDTAGVLLEFVEPRR